MNKKKKPNKRPKKKIKIRLKRKVKRFGCWRCGKYFTSWQKRIAHIEEDHRPPQKTVKEFIRTGEEHRLINGTNLKLGDKIIFPKEVIITKITITEGSNVVEVEVSVIKDNWEKKWDNKF